MPAIIPILRLLIACLFVCSFPGHAERLLPSQSLVLMEHEDPLGTLTLEEFLAIPLHQLEHRTQARAHGYTRSSFWARVLVPASHFNGDALWLQLEPVFLDQLTVYQRSPDAHGEWVAHELGDRSLGHRGDIDYRKPLLVLPRPRQNAGLELVFHYRSTSAVLLRGEVWAPAEFLSHASRETAFWSFYFGLAALSTGLALLLALLTRRKLAWLLCLFSCTYLLVACIQGYVDWLLGPTRLQLQHYLTGILTLASYGCLFWMCAEALNTRQLRPRLHRLVMTLVGIIFASLVSIPLDFYGTAIHFQFALCCVATVTLGCVSLRGLGRRNRSRMERGFSLAALWYLITAALALLSLFGILPFHKHLYALWQYGLVLNTLIVLILITLNVVNEERLERTRHQLAHELQVSREARLHQRQFVDMVAHEFRTPLSIISSALQNLQALPPGDAQRGGREANIARATERLVQLTDNCLADSRLEAGHLKIEREPTDIRKLIDKATDVARLSADHNLRIHLSLPYGRTSAELARYVQTDNDLLQIALSNLLDNAVKYSAGGEIEVMVELDSQSLTISVSDQGNGIEPALADGLFDRFQRGSQRKGGIGLGLHVAREIARAHGGNLQLSRNTASGCCFSLYLPHTEASVFHA